MKTLHLECDEIADLKMVRDELEPWQRGPFLSDNGKEGRRRINLLNKIIEHIAEGQPRVHGMHQVR